MFTVRSVDYQYFISENRHYICNIYDPTFQVMFLGCTWKHLLWDDWQKIKRLIGATRTNPPAFNKVTLWSWTHSCTITALSHKTLLRRPHGSRAELRHPDVRVYPAQYTWPQTPFPVTEEWAEPFHTAFHPPSFNLPTQSNLQLAKWNK